MKKTIALLLSLIMVLSFVACGNQINTDESSTTNEQTESKTSDSDETGVTEENTDPDETEASTESEDETSVISDSDETGATEEDAEPDEIEAPTESEDETSVISDSDETGATEEDSEPDEVEAPTESEDETSVISDSDEAGATEEGAEPDETAVSTEPEAETPAFDTSWAGDKYVMPIPAPPASDFIINEFVGSSGGNAVQVAAQDVQNLTNDEVVAYRQTLESLGFVNDIYERDFDSRQGYEFSAKNENGDIVYINYSHSAEYFILIFEFAK